MKKIKNLLLIPLFSLALTSCGSNDNGGNTPASSVASNVTSSSASTSTVKELRMYKKKVGSGYTLKVYKDELPNPDTYYIMFDCIVSRGEEDLTFTVDQFSTKVGENVVKASKFLVGLKACTNKIDGSRVPYAVSTTDFLTITESDPVVVMRIGFETEYNENLKLYYGSTEVKDQTEVL